MRTMIGEAGASGEPAEGIGIAAVAIILGTASICWWCFLCWLGLLAGGAAGLAGTAATILLSAVNCMALCRVSGYGSRLEKRVVVELETRND